MERKVHRYQKVLAAFMAVVMGMTTTALCNPVSAAEAPGEKSIQQQFYVDSKGNDETGDGSITNPFASLERARDAVRGINAGMTGDIVVNFAPGDYIIDQTVQFTKEDSGMNGHEIIYRGSGAPGSARLLGGDKVTGWTLADDKDASGFDLAADMVGKVYKLQLDPNIYNFNTLYVNGRRAEMARTLNNENNPRFNKARDEYMIALNGSARHINYPKDQFPQSAITGIQNALARGEEGAQLIGWDAGPQNWFTSTLRVTAIDPNAGSLSFAEDPSSPVSNRPKYQFWGGARFFVQGNLSFLDVPGEYHYNKVTGTLYYYPKEGEEDLNRQEVIVPRLQEIIHMEGDAKATINDVPDPSMQVHNITFQGLQAGYTEFIDSYSSGWNAFDGWGGVGVFPEEATQEGITNPSYCEQTERKEFRKGVFTLLQTNHITLDAMQVVNAGVMGLNAWGDNDHITITNSEFAYMGLHGINIDGGYPGPNTGKYSYGHFVTNNVIHDLGELVGQGTGIQALQVHDSEFSHIEIYNAGRRAIFLEGAWAARTAEEQNGSFDRFRDSSAYNNRFEYLYLHDLQQDGGDDGAIFFCTLYRYQGFPGNGAKDTKPNYLNQIYMNTIGAAPSTDDYTPNCINFDMGCGGVMASNIKAVNPQHYNIRYDESGGFVTFDNVNVAYYHPTTGGDSKTFDDSKMEYGQIGVDGSFPYPAAVTSLTEKSYESEYFRDEFDNGLDEWWSLAGKPQTTPVYYSDKDEFGPENNSFLADAFYNKSEEGCLIGKPFGSDLNKIVEIDFFDHTSIPKDNGYCGMSFQYKLNSFARVDDGALQRAIGVDYGLSSKYYAYKIGSISKATNVKREYGWHTFQWDYSDGQTVKMSIDGKQIAEAPAENFNYIEMGDYGMGGFNAYDNVVVYGGTPAPEPLPLPPPPDKEEPAPEIKALPGRIEAEKADKLPSTVQIVEGANGGKAIGYISKGDVYEYQVTATEDFELPLSALYASTGNAGFNVFLDENKVMSVPSLPKTGSWSTFKNYESPEKVTITAGEHLLKIQVTDNNFNLDSFGFVSEPETPPVQVASITPKVSGNLVLSIGNKIKVPVEVSPANAADKTLTWSTDADSSVLTLANDGTITAVGVGTGNVTVTSGANTEVSATFAVEVQDAEASLISTTEKGCVPTANVPEDHVDYKPERLINGILQKDAWAACGKNHAQHREDPSAYLTWDQPQTVKTIYLYDTPEGGNYVEKMEIIFDDDPDSKITLENGVPDGGMEVVSLPEAITASKIEFHILKATAPYKNYGFAEIKVFSAEPGTIPVNSVSFGQDGVTLFRGDKYTLKPPVVVPSSATSTALTVKIESGDDVISMVPYAPDGVVLSYTLTGLKEGTAVIRATSTDGVSGDFTVIVGSRDDLGAKIMEAEILYAKYPGPSDAHKALKDVIDSALQTYGSTNSMEAYQAAVQALDAAMSAFVAAANPAKTAQAIADALTLADPEEGSTTLQKPALPLGFKVAIKKASPENIVFSSWAILSPDAVTDVELTLEVTKIADGTSAQTVLSVNIPGVSPKDVLDKVEIPQPEKREAKLQLPKMPYGFAISVASSDDNRIAADGTITPSQEDQTVKAVIRVSKKLAGSSAEKQFTFTIPGVGKKLGTAIEASEIDGLSGSSIKVQNNEVLNFNAGNWIRYDNVDFGTGEKLIKASLNLAVHPDWAGKKVHFMLNKPDGIQLGSMTVQANPVGGNWGVYYLHTLELNRKLSGVHTLYLVGGPDDSGMVEGVGGVKELLLEVNTDPKTYTVTFMADSKQYDQKTANIGDKLVMPANPVKDGYTFLGWYTVETGGTQVTDFTTTMTVYAQFQKNSTPPPYVPPYTPPTTPIEPEEYAPASDDIAASVDGSGNANAAVSEDSFNKALEKAQEDAKKQDKDIATVVIKVDIPAGKDVSNLSLALPKKVLEQITNSKVDSVVIQLGSTGIAVALDQKAVAEILKQAGNDVQLTVVSVNSHNLGSEAKNAIGGRPVLDIKVNYSEGAKAVTSFGDGSVQITIPYELRSGEKPENVRAIYVDDNGKVTYLEDSFYEVNRKSVVLRTKHLSVYGIGYKVPENKPQASAHKVQKGDTLWSISKKYQCTIAQLVSLNGIKNPNLIYVGASLKIPDKQ